MFVLFCFPDVSSINTGEILVPAERKKEMYDLILSTKQRQIGLKIKKESDEKSDIWRKIRHYIDTFTLLDF